MLVILGEKHNTQKNIVQRRNAHHHLGAKVNSVRKNSVSNTVRTLGDLHENPSENPRESRLSITISFPLCVIPSFAVIIVRWPRTADYILLILLIIVDVRVHTV